MEIDFVGIVLSFLKTIFKILSFFLPPILTILFVFFFILLFHYFSQKKKLGIRKQKRDIEIIKRPGFFKKIFYLLPRQIAIDKIMENVDSFDKFGIHMICGEQGAGKTITAVYLMEKWKSEYPKSRIFSNITISFQDGKINHWKDIILTNNGIYGTVNFIDEMSTWFSSAESKDMPPEILGEISQQRKQKKAIIGTAQVFGRVAKPLREQTHFVYLPKTYFGCLTVVKMSNASDYDMEKNKFKKTQGIFFFIQTKELRNAYDTFEKVQRYSETHFSHSIYYNNVGDSND